MLYLLENIALAAFICLYFTLCDAVTTILETVRSWVVSTHLTWKRYLRDRKLDTLSFCNEAFNH